MLWPDILPEKSHSRLYTAIYHIRKAIAPYDNHLSLESTDEGYILYIKNSSIDLVEWEHQLSLLHQLNSENIILFEKAMELYSGPYLGKYDYIWAESERYRLEQLYINHALQAARFYEQQANYQQAIQWYFNVCNMRPDHEEAVLSLLKSLDRLDNSPLITYYYQQLEKAMAGLQLEVDKEIKDWYMKWIRKSPAIQEKN
ncbi:AfsR/SARP family transcriptional regulator [Ornithinibacillus scapharcae]|uniref:AfsR/SARP family transcriptional regulator n=1 Tax=Ornithinibacillus scapharcae TaxID=1147159 RepID=UPI001300C636|nr:BTAD domain-containing putative transcriptional regulator [Ornithinibacillus scapharcae]